MPNLTLTIEDTSPLLVFSDEWSAGTARADTSLELYSGGSYMQTTTAGARVFFSFQGTNVGIFGAKRQRNGFFQITVNDKSYTPVNGRAENPESFQTSLFTSITLPNAQHTVSLSDADTGVVDVDYVTWTTPVGKDDEEIIVNSFQDNDPSFKYSPADAWSANPPNIGTFSGGSGRITSKEGSTMEFTFQGDAISLYGPVGPKGAAYSVSIKPGNGLPNNYSTNKLLYRPNMMLYHANTLGQGPHTVTLTVLPASDKSGEPPSLAIDYAQVYTTPSLGGQRLMATPAPSGFKLGTVIGITAGGILGAVTLIGLVIWGVIYYNRKRHNGRFFYGFGEKPYKGESAPPTANTSDPQRARPFLAYESESNVESPPLPESRPPVLHSQSSYSQLSTPDTSNWPRTGGYDSSVDFLLPPNQTQTQMTPTGNTQVIVVPPRGSAQKYRPDRSLQLQPPPQGSRSRLGPTPAALGAAWQSVSPVQEESTRGQNGSRMMTIDSNLSPQQDNPLTAPPPEYSQANPSTAATSFYAREAKR